MWGLFVDFVEAVNESRRDYWFRDYVFGSMLACGFIFGATLLSLFTP